MRLSISWYLFFIFTLLLANQTVWAQNQSRQEFREYGLTGIERNGDNIQLHFIFCNPNQPDCSRQTLTDNDGLASIVAVLSEIKREYHCGSTGVTNERDAVPHWNQIKGFIEDQLIRSQDYCNQEICRINDPVMTIHNVWESASRQPKIYLMEHCGQLIRQSEEIIEEFDSNSRVTYQDLEELARLLDKATYSLYTVNGGSISKPVIVPLSASSDNIGEIARHHRKIQSLRIFDEKNRERRYFTGGDDKRPYHYPGCEGVRSGRVGELISNTSSSPSSNDTTGIQ